MVAFAFYKDTYKGGSIPEADWPFFESGAESQLNRYKRMFTVTVPEDLPDAESLAVCAMADALYYFTAVQNGSGGPLSSASIGSVSVTYAGGQAAVDLSPKGQEKELYRCAKRYLMIYRGVGGC